jgi:hypothetical protein
MMSKLTMKKNEDPTDLFERISMIENKYNDPTVNRSIDSEDIIATVLSAAPAEYKSVLTCEQRLKGTNLTVSDLEEAMHQFYDHLLVVTSLIVGEVKQAEG